MISLATCWLFRFLFDFLSMLYAFFDCAFRSLARSGFLDFGPPLGRSRGPLGRSWALLGRSWALLGVLGALLGALGRSWGALARFLVDLGLILLDVSRFFGDFLNCL